MKVIIHFFDGSFYIISILVINLAFEVVNPAEASLHKVLIDLIVYTQD